MKRLNYEIGAYGESLAKNFLRDQGYYILEQNFSCKIGEIDLIARDGDYICFVEVKTRYSQDYGTPGESITYHKRKKLYKIAQYYILINKIQNSSFRFDAVEIILLNSSFKLNLIKNII